MPRLRVTMRIRWMMMAADASVVMRKYLELNTDMYVDPLVPE
ncbi:hypothetical protein [Paenibacillus amylolyticus]|uniref:Uncharacterized protein n=1 Tax=Paenibacillus amylolyticus TaxID=1451 RepID=A0ABD8B278_PAEAM